MNSVALVVRAHVESEASIDSHGLVFWLASGSVNAMGAKLGRIPENADRRLFASPPWEGLPSESDEVKSLKANGDVVLVIWDDGAGVIYRNNRRYRWN